MRHEKGRTLWFDVSDVPVGDTVLNSELRVFKQYNEKDEITKFSVKIYQIMIDFNG